ncbi:DNA modification methylase (plasmid) [Micrococcus luteus]
MKLPVHRWFRYSAGFSAEWARSVIRENGAQHVLDPFGGSGTTMIAAEEQGVEGIGAEVHPFVVRVAKAKLEWRLDPAHLVARGDAVVKRARAYKSVQRPTAPLIAKCFPDPDPLDDLVRLRDAVLEEEQDGYGRILWLALVSIIRLTSPAGTAQWQYVLPNKRKSRVAQPYPAFQERVALFAEDMTAMQSTHADSPEGRVIETDARHLDGVPDGWADLILTSPPYANNYDYADATRLEQTFLGEIDGWGALQPLRTKLLKSATQNVSKWDPAEALDSPLLDPIRAELMPVYEQLNRVKQNKGGKKAYDAMIAGYFFDSAQNWKALRRAAAPGARACFVVGDSAPYGVHVPVERWLAELALASGFKSWSFEKVRDRNTKWKNRKHDHPLHEGRLWIEG